MPENLPEYGFKRPNRGELEKAFERLSDPKAVESGGVPGERPGGAEAPEEGKL